MRGLKWLDGGKPFEWFTLLAIVVNSIVLAMHNPFDPELGKSLDAIGMVLTLVFTVEMTVAPCCPPHP